MDLKEKYIIARWSYAIGKDFISDIEYDRLEEQIKSENLLPEYTSRGWNEDPCPYTLLNKYNLSDFITPVIFTYRTESIQSLNSDFKVEQELSDLQERSRLSVKIDGWSLRLSYYNGKFVTAQTRNRNETNHVELESIFPLFPKEIKYKGKILILGELVLKNKTFEEYKVLRNIISQRNGVATAIANGDIEYLDFRCYNLYCEDENIDYGMFVDSNRSGDCDKYTFLRSLGFKVPEHIYVENYQQLLSAIKIIGNRAKFGQVPADGFVLENEHIQYALRVGYFQEQVNKSYVTGYTFNRGMYNDAVLVKIKPINLGHKTIKEIPVTNIQTVIDNNLRIGYPIIFAERSAVNSIIDTTVTEQYQKEWIGRYDEYRYMIDSVYGE